MDTIIGGAAPLETPASGAAPAGAAPAQQAAFEPWVQNVPKTMVTDDMRGHKSQWDYLQTVYKARDEAAEKLKGYEGAVKIPGKDAKPEEIAAFRKALGVPEDPKGYQFDDLPPERVAKLAETAHKIGLTPDQALALAKMDLESEKADDEAFAQEMKIAKDETLAALKKEYPADYEARIQGANATLSKFFGPEGMKEIAESGLGFKSWFVMGMLKMAEPFKEGRVITQGGAQEAADGLVAKYPSMAHLKKRTW